VTLQYSSFEIAMTSFLVLIDSGSRYEVHHPSGISHFLEKLAFAVSDRQQVPVVSVHLS